MFYRGSAFRVTGDPGLMTGQEQKRMYGRGEIRKLHL